MIAARLHLARCLSSEETSMWLQCFERLKGSVSGPFNGSVALGFSDHFHAETIATDSITTTNIQFRPQYDVGVEEWY